MPDAIDDLRRTADRYRAYLQFLNDPESVQELQAAIEQLEAELARHIAREAAVSALVMSGAADSGRQT